MNAIAISKIEYSLLTAALPRFINELNSVRTKASRWGDAQTAEYCTTAIGRIQELEMRLHNGARYHERRSTSFDLSTSVCTSSDQGIKRGRSNTIFKSSTKA